MRIAVRWCAAVAADYVPQVHFYIIADEKKQLKYSTLNAERRKKLLCMSCERIQWKIQLAFSLLRIAISIFYEQMFCTPTVFISSSGLSTRQQTVFDFSRREVYRIQ